MDFGDYGGHKFLISVDHCSGWQFVTDMGRHATASQLVKSVRDLFCMAGVFNVVWTDGGPQFRSKEFQDFIRRWGVKHYTSSPGYPQSNGRAEAAVKSTKKLIRRCWNPQSRQLDQELWVQGVLQHRNTPGPSGRSPAEILYGRPVRDLVPAHRRNFAAEWQTSADAADAAAARRQERVEARYNSRATDLPVLQVGARVAVQDQDTKRWDRYGQITEVGKNRRYLIKMTSGRVLSRNRRHIRRRFGHATPDDLLASDRGTSLPCTASPSRPVAPSTAAPPSTGATSGAYATTPGPVTSVAPAGPAASPRATTSAAPPALTGLRRSQRTRRRPDRLIENV